MSKIETENRALLETFVVDNSELERLEQLLGQFNIFEAVGAVRHELRHSDFLAFLLDPRQNHGLGDEFIRLVLQKTLFSANKINLPISLIDLDVWNLTEIEVSREWQNIDILLVDNTHQVVVVIENKIGSNEHSNQLQRYREIVKRNYPNWKIICIFLTPDGDIPSDDNYVPIDYNTICLILERLIEKRSSTLGTDVRTLIAHYTQMLRRHIVSESEIAELCRRIYKKHKLALDLIFEHRPDEQAATIEIIRNLIEASELLRIDTTSKTLIRFAPVEWYENSELMQGKGWTPTGQVILFECYNRPDHLKIVLYIGPGEIEVRQKLFSIARQHETVFRTQSKSLNQKWNSIYSKKLLQKKDFEEEQLQDLQVKIEKAWKDFIENDLAKIMNAVREALH